MEWFKFRPAIWYRLTRGMSASAKGKFIEDTVDALMDGKTGATPLADAMLAEAAELSARQAERRRKKPANRGSESQTADNRGEPRLTAVNRGEPEATNKKERKNTKEPIEILTPGEESGGGSLPSRAREGTETTTPPPPSSSVLKEIHAVFPSWVTAEEVAGRADACGMPPQWLTAWYDYYSGRGWKGKDGAPLAKGMILKSIPAWKARQEHFDAKDKAILEQEIKDGTSSTHIASSRGRGPRIAATEYRDDPFS